MTTSGSGSERPFTMCQMFLNAVKMGGDNPALHVEREKKKLCWSWNQFNIESMKFAKAINSLKVTEKSAVAIMGFNAPEWLFSCIGAILNNCVFTGIYITNTEDACFYQADHSEAEIICVETTEHLKRFTVNIEKFERVKAFVVWGEKELPAEFQGNSRFYLWKDFQEIGSQVPDQTILDRMEK